MAISSRRATRRRSPRSLNRFMADPERGRSRKGAAGRRKVEAAFSPRGAPRAPRRRLSRGGVHGQGGRDDADRHDRSARGPGDLRRRRAPRRGARLAPRRTRSRRHRLQPHELHPRATHDLPGDATRYLPTVNSKHLDAIVHSTRLDRGCDAREGRHRALPRGRPRAPGRAAPVPLAARRSSSRCTGSMPNGPSGAGPRGTVLRTAAMAERARPGRDDRGVARPRRALPPPLRPPDRATSRTAWRSRTHRPPDEIRRRFGLRGGDYVLFVGRLVPEKAPGPARCAPSRRVDRRRAARARRGIELHR